MKYSRLYALAPTMLVIGCAGMTHGSVNTPAARDDNYNNEHPAHPPQGRGFPEGQAAVATLAQTALPAGSTALRAYVTDAGWNMYRNKVSGAILGRTASAEIHYRDGGGKCWIVRTQVYEQEQGGSWGRPQSWSGAQDAASDTVGTPEQERSSGVLGGFTFTREACASIQALPAPAV